MSLKFNAPILIKSQDILENDSYRLEFIVPKEINVDEIACVETRITSYYDNQIFRSSRDEKISISQNKGVLNYELEWGSGKIYRLQIRFRGKAIINSSGEIEEDVSEWSKVLLIKRIDPPILLINNNANEEIVDSSSRPRFIGKCSISEQSKEAEYKYRFSLFDQNNNLIEESKEIIHDASQEDSYRFDRELKDNSQYFIKYEISTLNHFVKSVIKKVSIHILNLGQLNGISLSANSNEVECREEGSIKIVLSPYPLEAETSLSGKFVLSRSSSKSGFSLWEDLAYFFFSPVNPLEEQTLFVDTYLENGVCYQYAFAKEYKDAISKVGYRTEPVKTLQTHPVELEHCYLGDKDCQLKIKYDTNISGYKKNILESKVNTLGGKYPIINRNGSVYNTEFSLKGTISLLEDENHYFFKNPLEKFQKYSWINEKGDKEQIFKENDVDLTFENITNEKTFRDAVETFLYDGHPKIFRSATEGCHIVNLMNISLNPKSQLGRMIYDFSATVCEIADFNLKNVKKYDLLDVSKRISSYDSETGQLSTGFGQILVDKNNAEEQLKIIDTIKKQENQKTPEVNFNYRKLKKIRFSKRDKRSLQILMNSLHEENNSEEESYSFNKESEIEYYYPLALEAIPIKITSVQRPSSFNEIWVNLERGYEISDPNLLDSISEITIESEYVPLVIIDYIYEGATKIVSDIEYLDEAKPLFEWGQLLGLFIDSPGGSSTFSLSAEESEKHKILDLYDDQTLYSSQDIKEVILENIKKDSQKEEYQLGSVEYISIEIFESFNEPGFAELKIGDNKDPIQIGPTEIYTLYPARDLIPSISFASPTIAKIDYKCYCYNKRKFLEG